jgi:hypothetical protein
MSSPKPLRRESRNLMKCDGHTRYVNVGLLRCVNRRTFD